MLFYVLPITVNKDVCDNTMHMHKTQILASQQPIRAAVSATVAAIVAGSLL